jgi:Mg-chelatase subunit ChlD
MLIFSPILPWSLIAAVSALLAALTVLLRGFLDTRARKVPWRNFGGGKRTRLAALSLTLLSALLFAAAAMNPYWTDKPGTEGFHLQVAVDVSGSVMRAHGGWQAVKNQAYEKIADGVNSVPSDLLENCTAGIVTFRGATNEAWGKKPLSDLPNAFSQLTKNLFAGGDGTDIESGLKRAALHIEKAGGQGAILLISDGNQTAGDALSQARLLANRGIPVHVLTITSRGPAVAISDADLPRQIHTEATTHVRGLMLNRLPTEKAADLTLSHSAGEWGDNSTEPQEPVSTETRVTLPSGQWVRFRWPLIVEEFGIQFIDLTLNPLGGSAPHIRRFFTYAKRPPRILAIGGDLSWMEGISADVIDIIPHDPTVPINASHLKDIDAIILNSVPARYFSWAALDSMVKLVEQRGIGLMLINGDHRGADVKDETVIMSYKDTRLEPLLPVKGGPRPFMDEPPSRQVAILIDTSGSMMGWRMQKAKEIAKHIVKNLLRPQDRLDLITFTTGAGHLMEDHEMDEYGKEQALALIDRITPGGGTDPKRALDLIGNRQMAECGLIFISDGEFGLVGYRPDCRATAFEIGGYTFSRSTSMKELADPIAVNMNFDPKAIRIPYFQPEPRDKFYEKEPFRPLSMEQHLPPQHQLPVPYLYLPGSAVTHLKEGSILNGVRPKLTDPILAFKEAEAGYVGFFASAIPMEWARKKEGRKAIEAWLSRLIPFMDRDRYDFKLEDRGKLISIRISLNTKAGTLPNITRMSAGIQFPGQETAGIILKADDTAPATYRGLIRVTRTQQPRRGILFIREFGPGALPRPQRIPILIPPAGKISASTRSEAHTYGKNTELLQKISEIGGGHYDAPSGTPFFNKKPSANKGTPLWILLVSIAAFTYLAAIALKRWNP